MNKDEYIIINKSVLDKRIEELKYQRELAGNLFEDREYNLNYISIELRVLEQFLSQSTPLIHEIKKAFDEGQNRMQHEIIEKLGLKYQIEQVSQSTILNMEVHSDEYISNLKLVL